APDVSTDIESGPTIICDRRDDRCDWGRSSRRKVRSESCGGKYDGDRASNQTVAHVLFLLPCRPCHLCHTLELIKIALKIRQVRCFTGLVANLPHQRLLLGVFERKLISESQAQKTNVPSGRRGRHQKAWPPQGEQDQRIAVAKAGRGPGDH